ncbi:MAG: MBL fold metallo-hydrolase [Proteobacteria bacterium]|nr:MAG: MBL fold metallo-hydrolase [Pseudomonadota bacterium]
MFKSILLAIAPLSLLACSASAVQTTSAKFGASQIYTFESDGAGFNTKTFFYDNGEEVVAFDTQFTPALAQASIDYLRTKTQNPITFAVITHPNPDKFNGIEVFQAQGAKVIAARATAEAMNGVHEYKKYFFVNIAKMFSEETYPKLGRVDQTFEKDHSIRLRNGSRVSLSELSHAGVSGNQTVAYIADLNALVVGDLVHEGAHAWLEGGIVDGKPSPNIAGWIADLKELELKFGARNPLVLGGRGQAVKLNKAAPAHIDYLQKADEIVTAYVAALGNQKAELGGEKAGSHHAELQRQMEGAFPQRTLGYLIQYGVYGLANSKL